MGASQSSSSPSDFFVVHQGEKAMSNVATDKVQTLIMFKAMFRLGADSYKIKRKEDENEVLQVVGEVLTIRDRMVLRDMSGKPVAVLIGPRGNWKPNYYIYGVEPKLPGQEPSGVEQDVQDGVKLYSWAYAAEGSGMRATYQLYLATGNNQYEELGYTASAGILDPKICIEKQGKGGACLAERANEDYEVTVAAGIDPALMITFVAAIKEIQEMNT